MRVALQGLARIFHGQGTRCGQVSTTRLKFHYSLIRKLRGLSRLPILSLGLSGVNTSFRIPDTLTKSSLDSILKVAFCTGSFILAPRMKIATAPRASRVLFVMRQSNKFAYFW